MKGNRNMGRYGGGNNTKAAKKQAKLPVVAAPKDSTESTQEESKAEKIQKLMEAIEKEARERGYYSNHTLCSAMAFLMGVPEKNFLRNEPRAALQREVYDRLKSNEKLCVLRWLCMLRCVIMRHFGQIVKPNWQLSFYQNLSSYDELGQEKIFDKLHRAGCDLNNPGNDLAAYLLHINDTIKRYVDSAKSLSQLEGVDFTLLRNALLYPGGYNSSKIQELSKAYNDNRLVYPFGWYINLDFAESSGNVMEADDRFVEFLYHNSGLVPPVLSQFRTRITNTTKNELRQFLDKRGNYRYLPFVDGSTTRVETILPLLQTLHEMNDSQIAPIVLYCPRSAEEAWRSCLQEQLDCETIKLVLPETQSGGREWGMELAADTALRLQLEPENTLMLLIGPADFYLSELAESLVLDEARGHLSRVLLAKDPSNQMAVLLTQLGQQKQLYIDDIIKPEKLPDIETMRQPMARQALERHFPITLRNACYNNLFTLVDETLDNLPLTYTKQERIDWCTALQKRLTVKIGNAGQLSIALLPG